MMQGHQEVKHSQQKRRDWQDRFRNIKIGRKGVEEAEKIENSTMASPFYDDNMYILNMKNDLEAKARNLQHVQLVLPI